MEAARRMLWMGLQRGACKGKGPGRQAGSPTCLYIAPKILYLLCPYQTVEASAINAARSPTQGYV